MLCDTLGQRIECSHSEVEISNQGNSYSKTLHVKETKSWDIGRRMLSYRHFLVILNIELNQFLKVYFGTSLTFRSARKHK